MNRVRRSILGRWMLVWLLLVVPSVVDAVTLTYPGPAPCDTTLQGCIDAAAAGDVVEVATNTPIDESLTIDKSLTLRPAAGFTPTLAPSNFILAVSSGSGAFDFMIEGITLQRGFIGVRHGSSGVLTATIRGNVIQDTLECCPPIGVFGEFGGQVVFMIEDNDLDVPTPAFGDSTGISVSQTDGSGIIRGNVIRMQPNSQGRPSRSTTATAPSPGT